MKSLIGKLGMLALLATGVVAGCSSSQTPSTGTGAVSDGHEGHVGLSLVPVSGVTLNSVHYVVSNGATPAVNISEGDLPTAGPASTFSFGLSLPVGTGYTISLSAASAETGDDITCAGSYGPFAVTPNSSTAFTMTLTCKDNTSGALVGGVDVKTDACPRLVFDYAVASPSSADVNKTIALATKAHDLDGKTVSYAWKIAKPATGTFAPATGATSTFTCAQQDLGQTVTVTASNGECTKDLTTTISCKSVLCGNGVVDPGESCDTATVCAPGATNCIPGNKCTSNCVFTCGNGVVEPPAEACEPKGTANCDDSCQVRAVKCLDNFISTGEECDPTANPPVPPGSAPGSTCDQTCHIHGVVCGNGIVEAGEACDPGPTGASPSCSADCKIKVSTDACVSCETTGDCAASVDNCKGPASAPFTLAQQTACYATMACIESSNCLDGTGTLGKCYCGTLSTSACGAAPFDLTAAGAPNGPCAAVMQAGMTGFTSNSAILAGLTASSKPAGAGDQRLNCQKTAGCTDVCGFTPGGPAFP